MKKRSRKCSCLVNSLRQKPCWPTIVFRYLFIKTTVSENRFSRTSPDFLNSVFYIFLKRFERIKKSKNGVIKSRKGRKMHLQNLINLRAGFCINIWEPARSKIICLYQGPKRHLECAKLIFLLRFLDFLGGILQRSVSDFVCVLPSLKM